MVDIDNLQTMLDAGQDNALLRFALGSAFLKNEKYEEAIEHLSKATEQNPDHSAAWKLYGKALVAINKTEEAKDIFTRGIDAANKNGDIQSIKEMQVFLKRIT
jgi:tetratricopeptide (TPR) repeat protein